MCDIVGLVRLPTAEADLEGEGAVRAERLVRVDHRLGVHGDLCRDWAAKQ